MHNLTLAQQIAIMVVPLIFAITTHEVAHGWVASRLGDKTALMLGRITFNPIKHIDPIGTVLVPGLLIYLGGIIFGWAKPVPVNFRNLNNPKRDMALVALAGPMTNFIMAVAWGGILKLGLYAVSIEINGAEWLIYMAWFGIQINLLLMVLNVLPIPPLDGSRVLESLLPGRLPYYYSQLEPYGFVILLALIYFGVLWRVILPPVNFIMFHILSTYQISPYISQTILRGL